MSKEMMFLVVVADHMRDHGAKRFTLEKSLTGRRVILRGWDGERMVMARDLHTCRRLKRGTEWHTREAIKQRCDAAYQRYNKLLYDYCVARGL